MENEAVDAVVDETENGNESEKALADVIVELQAKLADAEKKRAEADARALELVKVLRNAGTQRLEEEPKQETVNELVKDLFD